MVPDPLVKIKRITVATLELNISNIGNYSRNLIPEFQHIPTSNEKGYFCMTGGTKFAGENSGI
jgi:hypothetical protein